MNFTQQTPMAPEIVDNFCYLEGVIEKQQEIIKKLEFKMNNIQLGIYHLFGGLYNHDTQSIHLDRALRILFKDQQQDSNDSEDPEYAKDSEDTEHDEDEDHENTSRWSFWPTTRQGDNNEERIAVLEAEIASLKMICQQQNGKEEKDRQLLSRKMSCKKRF
jgi:hypothetical protein